MSDKLILYVDPAWKRGGQPVPLLFPFWGNPYEESSLFAKEMFDAHQFDTSLYAITDDITQAHMVLAPYRYQWFLRHDMGLYHECLRTAQEAKLPMLLDAVGDIEYPIDVPNVYKLRIGGFRFLPEERRIQIPPASDDLLERCAEGKFVPREKRQGKPSIGFAGWAHLSIQQRLRVFVKELPITMRGLLDSRYRAMHKGVIWRERATSILARSNKVECNFKLRPSFSGSTHTASNDMRKLRQELVDVVLGSDYALDVRGDANDSTRLFEICSLGRIPVTVDTERNFPFSDVVDYKEFCIFVDFRDIKRLPEIVADFHASVLPEKYLDMQRKAREAFVNHFRIDAQMKGIERQLNKLGFRA
jgi:hypothetical protein